MIAIIGLALIIAGAAAMYKCDSIAERAVRRLLRHRARRERDAAIRSAVIIYNNAVRVGGTPYPERAGSQEDQR
jgi:hypothetical protein